LYEKRLAGNRSRFAVTLDEANFGLHCVNGKRKICYIPRGQQIPESWYDDKDNFRKTFMVVGGISGRGTLPLILVPKKVKVDAKWYIQKVLRPIIENHLPKLYPGELDKVFIHHDAASSHTSQKTTTYAKEVLNKHKITIIPKSEIPVKSPDCSPLDFFGFGYLKRRVFWRKPKTMRGLWKVLKSEWSKIDQGMVDRTFQSWKRRCRLIVKKGGNHIENTKDIHRRRR